MSSKSRIIHISKVVSLLIGTQMRPESHRYSVQCEGGRWPVPYIPPRLQAWVQMGHSSHRSWRKNGQRDPQEYRAAGFLTISWHIPSTYLGWILYGRVRRAEPRVKLMHPPLCQNTAGCFIREHHHRALDAALTSAHPDSVCSKPIHPPLLKKSPKSTGEGDVVMKGVGDVSWVFVCFCFI